jgi:hypothetical protein
MNLLSLPFVSPKVTFYSEHTGHFRSEYRLLAILSKYTVQGMCHSAHTDFYNFRVLELFICLAEKECTAMKGLVLLSSMSVEELYSQTNLRTQSLRLYVCCGCQMLCSVQ